MRSTEGNNCFLFRSHRQSFCTVVKEWQKGLHGRRSQMAQSRGINRLWLADPQNTGTRSYHVKCSMWELETTDQEYMLYTHRHSVLCIPKICMDATCSCTTHAGQKMKGQGSKERCFNQLGEPPRWGFTRSCKDIVVHLSCLYPLPCLGADCSHVRLRVVNPSQSLGFYRVHLWFKHNQLQTTAESHPIWRHTAFRVKTEIKKPDLKEDSKFKGMWADGHPILIHSLRLQPNHKCGRDGVLIQTWKQTPTWVPCWVRTENRAGRELLGGDKNGSTQSALLLS